MPDGFKLNGTWVAQTAKGELKMKFDNGYIDLFFPEQPLPLSLLYKVDNQSNPMDLILGTPNRDLGTMALEL